MTRQDELRELIEQATEHLRYYRDIGVTHIEESVRPSIEQSTQPVREIQTQPATPVTQAEKTLAAMTRKSEPSSTSGDSLFNDPAADSHAGETLEDIRTDLGDCRRCKLWSMRTNIVFGEGSPNAELMFVGEGPGADEDASGRPFVGRAGQLLTKMIEAIGYKREDVYIANVVKSRPPGNRTPEKDEMETCSPFLYRQITVIRPKLIVTLGNPATQALLNTKIGITKLRGEFQQYPRLPDIKVLPTFHPAFLLRSPDKKREAWEDLKKVRAFLKGELEA